MRWLAPFGPIAAFALVLMLLASCAALRAESEENPRWIYQEVRDGPPRRDLFQLCHIALVRADFTPGDSDEAIGRVTSGWSVMLQPWSKQGWRAQGIIDVEPLERSGDYMLKIRVRKERNMEVHKTLEIRSADWEEIADDLEWAHRVRHHILSQIQVGGPSEDFYRRFQNRGSSEFRSDGRSGTGG